MKIVSDFQNGNKTMGKNRRKRSNEVNSWCVKSVTSNPRGILESHVVIDRLQTGRRSSSWQGRRGREKVNNKTRAGRNTLEDIIVRYRERVEGAPWPSLHDNTHTRSILMPHNMQIQNESQEQTRPNAISIGQRNDSLRLCRNGIHQEMDENVCK